MKNLPLSLLLLPALFLAPSCSKAEVEAKASQMADATKGALDKIDFSALSPAALKEKFNEYAGTLTEELDSIKDKATAEKVRETLQPIADRLAKMKTAVGDKMPSMDSIKTAVEDFKTKFANNPAVMDVLKPLLDKLQSLFN